MSKEESVVQRLIDDTEANKQVWEKNLVWLTLDRFETTVKDMNVVLQERFGKRGYMLHVNFNSIEVNDVIKDKLVKAVKYQLNKIQDDGYEYDLKRLLEQ